MLGKRNGHPGRVAFPLLVTQHAQSWRQGLSIWCVVSTDRQATTASPDVVLDPMASDVGKHRPLVGSLGNALASGVVYSTCQDRSRAMVILYNSDG